MSRAAVYKIRSKDESKTGVASAMQNLKGFDNQLKALSGSFKSLLKFGAITGALRMVAGGLREISDAMGVEQKRNVLLAQSIRNNPLLNGQSFTALKAYNSQLQAHSIYGNEQLDVLAAQLAAQGRSEEQIKSIMDASVNLASSGVMPLESAVKNMSKTYSGMAGELGESIPAMRELTKEQLANGEGVALVARQYAGMAEAMAGTREGIKAQRANLIGDIKESLGDILTTLTGDFNAKTLPIFQKINDWLNTNKEKIINLFRYFPQVAGDTFVLIKGILAKVFTPEFWVTFGSIAWEQFKASARNAFRILGAFISAIATTFWEPLKWGFSALTAGIKAIFAGVINFFIDKINFLAEKAHNLGQFLAHPIDETKRTAFSGGIGRIGGNIEGPGAFPVDAIGEAWKTAAETAAEAIADQIQSVKDSWTAVTEASSQMFGQEMKEFLDDVNEKLTIPVVTALEEAQEKLQADEAAASTEGGEAATSGIKTLFQDLLAGATLGLSEIIGVVVDALKKVESFAAVLNWAGTILDGLMSVIGPVVDTLFKPIAGGLRIIGQLLGAILVPYLNLLGPVILFISKAFVWLYNKALVPFANLFIKIGNILYNGFIAIINGVIGLINKIPGIRIKKLDYKSTDEGTLSAISMDDLTTAGDAASGGSSSGYGATYTGGQNITNNWYISIGAMTGDQDTFQQFVRLITLEQKRAERLGLV